jgi:hypothetical protein
MSHIYRFLEFGKVFETSEFNLQRFNQDAGQMAVHVDNPQLSINAYDKHQDAIRSATSKINSLLISLSNTPQFNVLKSRLSLEDQNITSMKVLRIFKSNGVNYNVYISFVIKDLEYWGLIENVLSSDPVFKSEVFKEADLIQSKEWVVKIKGLVIKIIKRWLTPENGKYKLINDEAYCINQENGKMLKIEKDSEVEVIRSFDNKIIIKHDSQYYSLTGDSYIYFNYWFLKS